MSEQKFIYFVRPVGMDGPIKIGCSAKPISRLKVLASWSPFELEFIGTVPGSFAEEGLLHSRFSHLHTRKEWFMTSPTLRETIEAILAGKSVKDACAALPERTPIRNQKRPVPTDDRKLFLYYGHRIRAALKMLWRKNPGGNWRKPADIVEIMHNWRRDRMNGHEPIIPTAEQMDRLNEFLADPEKFCVYEPYRTVPKQKKDPICIPIFDVDAEAA